MKLSTPVVCVVIAVVTLLQSTSTTNGHITLPGHFGVGVAGIPSTHQLSLLSAPLPPLHSHRVPQTPTVPFVGPNLLLATKIVAIMTFLADNPKILCITPPFLVADLLGRLSSSALVGAVPHEVVYRFVSSVYAVPSLSSAVPSDVYASLIRALQQSSSAPGVVQASSDTAVAATPAPAAAAAAAATPEATSAYPGSPSPAGVVASSQSALAATPTNCAPSGTALPGVAASSQKTLAVTPTGPSALPEVAASSQKNVAVTPTDSSALPNVVASSQKELTVTPTGPSALLGVAATSQTAVGILPNGGGGGGGGSSPPGVAAVSEAAASVVPTAGPSQPAAAAAPQPPPSAVTAIAQTTLQAQGGPGSAGMNVALLISLLRKGASNASPPPPPPPCGLVGGAHNKGCSSSAAVKKPISPFKIHGQYDVLVPSKPPTIAPPPPPPPPPTPPRVKPQSPDKFTHTKIHHHLVTYDCFVRPASAAGQSKPALIGHPPLLPPSAPCPTNGGILN